MTIDIPYIPSYHTIDIPYHTDDIYNHGGMIMIMIVTII